VRRDLRGDLHVAVVALALASCAPTINLLNPTSPEFRGDYATAAARDGASAGSRVRVVSFNIKLADQIDPAIEVLRSDALRDADIISLQEMDESGVERIAHALRLNYIYYPGSIHPTRQRYFGPAILTRWPIGETRKLILPHEAWGRKQRRNATAATINVRGHCLMSRGNRGRLQQQRYREILREKGLYLAHQTGGQDYHHLLLGSHLRAWLRRPRLGRCG
jgi:hypothetical protein